MGRARPPSRPPPVRSAASLQPGPWAEAVRARALESASKCRSASAPPPRIAYCIGGAARSFATPLVLTLLRHNLITALGGSNESRLFLQLKVGDSDKLGMSSTASFMKHNESTTANLAAALDVEAPWLGSLVGEAMLIDGNGAPAEPEGTSRQELVVAPNAEVWSQYRARSCSVNVTVNATVQPCCNREPYLDQANNEERLLLHHLSLLWCRGAIERYEAAAGAAFDLVVFSRPDLVWWKPIIPWCAWPSERSMLACTDPGCDMAYVAPRLHMERLFTTALQHRDCASTSFRTRVESCCGASEFLTRHARRAFGNQSAIPVTAEYSRFLVVRDSESIESARLATVSPLRFVQSVCELAFDYAFAHSQLNISAVVNRHTKDAHLYLPRRGLPIATIVNLRLVLNQNATECARMLAFVEQFPP